MGFVTPKEVKISRRFALLHIYRCSLSATLTPALLHFRFVCVCALGKLGLQLVLFDALTSSPPTPSIGSDNMIGPNGATAIAAPLALLTSLQTLDLRCAGSR